MKKPFNDSIHLNFNAGEYDNLRKHHETVPNMESGNNDSLLQINRFCSIKIDIEFF